jgi:membrane associated rhomboid family serine protease
MGLCERFGFVAAHPTLSTALLSMWLHDPDHVAHIAGNLVALVVVGSVVEPVLGRWWLLALFVAAGLGGAAVHLLVATGSEVPLVGASGGLCRLMPVGAVVRPRLMPAFVMSYIALNLLGLFVQTALVPAGVSVADHIGGFAAEPPLSCSRGCAGRTAPGAAKAGKGCRLAGSEPALDSLSTASPDALGHSRGN